MNGFSKICVFAKNFACLATVMGLGTRKNGKKKEKYYVECDQQPFHLNVYR
jgi:hypothetical protein